MGYDNRRLTEEGDISLEWFVIGSNSEHNTLLTGH